MTYLDQNGAVVEARTVAELRKIAGGGRVHKLYRDKVTWGGRETTHIGYEIKGRTFEFKSGEKP